MELNGKTGLYLLLGDPVEHSLSPAMQNAALAAENINAVYLAAAVKHDDIDMALNGIRSLNVLGANVTSPLKEVVIPCLDVLSDEAELLQSVNTIINRKGKLFGHTTDGDGFYRALMASLKNYDSARPIVFFGAGGAARAAAYNLALKGHQEIILVNRSRENSERLAEMLAKSTAIRKLKILDLDSKTMNTIPAETQAFVYTLPLDHPAVLSYFVTASATALGKTLIDFRYSPETSRVMSAFRTSGGKAENGLAMLLWQGVKAFELLTGKKAPLRIMRSALYKKK